MRTKNLLVLGAVALCSFLGCKRVPDTQVLSRMKGLLFHKEYFRLRDLLESNASQLDDFHRLYYKAFVENAFNRDSASLADIKTLLTDDDHLLSDSDKINLLGIQEVNYYCTDQYRNAWLTDESLLQRFGKILNKAEIRDTRNSVTIWKALADIPPQSISWAGNTVLHWIRDKIGLMEVPVRCGGSDFSMVFDTRAGISTVTESLARSMHLKRLPVSYDLGSGITGILFKSGLGVADSLWLGNILLQHVIFQVVGDSMLYFAPIQFSLSGILGYAAMKQLPQVDILSGGEMLIPGRTIAHAPQDLALDGYDPVIPLVAYGDTLNFYFDSGATSSDLYNLFYRKFKSRVDRLGKPDTIELGGAGGVIRSPVWVLSTLSMQFGHWPVLLKKAEVHTRPVTDEAEKFYGNIGQDFMSQFKEFIINFRKMFIWVR